MTVASRNGYLGYHSDATGDATVEGADSKWTLTADLNIGFNGVGMLSVRDGGAVEVGRTTFVGRTIAGSSSINFDDGTLTTKSLWASPSQLHGDGTINTNGLVSDIDLVFDGDHPAQQQIVLDSEPDQNITINLHADGNGAIGVGFAARDR